MPSARAATPEGAEPDKLSRASLASTIAAQRRWHGYVGVDLTGKTDGANCGHIGLAYPCDSYEDGIAKALDWLRNHDAKLHSFLLRTFEINVRYF